MDFHRHILAFATLAGKNLLRRVVRTSLAVTGVALAVAVAVSLAGFVKGYHGAITRSIDMLGFQVMVMAKGCPYEAATMMLKGGTGLLYLPDSIYTNVATDTGVASITPVFIGVAEKEQTSIQDDGAGSFIVVSGIEVPSFTTMKPWLSFQTGTGFDGGRWFTTDTEVTKEAPENIKQEVVLGYEVAEYEQRKVGDTIALTITPSGAVSSETHEYTVAGILSRTGTQDDGTVFMPLSSAQRIFNRPSQITVVGVKLKEFSSQAIRQFEERWISLPEVQIVGLQQVKSTLLNLISTAQAMIGAVAVIAIVVAIIGVINTILMSIHERTGEIGIMKAIGASRSDIFELIWYETLALCLLGGLAGIIVAYGGSGIIEFMLRHLIELGVQGEIVVISPGIIGLSLGGTVLVGFFAGLYPAWRASSMRPLEAIRAGE
jgi:putative ABC transport system permease protein